MALNSNPIPTVHVGVSVARTPDRDGTYTVAELTLVRTAADQHELGGGSSLSRGLVVEYATVAGSALPNMVEWDNLPCVERSGELQLVCH